jgi:hypothetical protein
MAIGLWRGACGERASPGNRRSRLSVLRPQTDRNAEVGESRAARIAG